MSRRLRIAMLDSGVIADHPHMQRPLAGGITITPSSEQEGFQDRLGHGTAICALLQQMAPDADILAVKIFDTRLATSLPIVLRAIDWCLAQQVDVINLSLGTSNQDHLPRLVEARTDLLHRFRRTERTFPGVDGIPAAAAKCSAAPAGPHLHPPKPRG